MGSTLSRFGLRIESMEYCQGERASCKHIRTPFPSPPSLPPLSLAAVAHEARPARQHVSSSVEGADLHQRKLPPQLPRACDGAVRKELPAHQPRRYTPHRVPVRKGTHHDWRQEAGAQLGVKGSRTCMVCTQICYAASRWGVSLRYCVCAWSDRVKANASLDAGDRLEPETYQES